MKPALEFVSMFSSFFNQVKEGLAAAAEPPPNPPPQQAPPSKPAQQETSGADFLGGLLSVANQVGQAINEKNQPEVKQPPPTPEKPQDAPKISQEDIALISQGLGALGLYTFSFCTLHRISWNPGMDQDFLA
ncbi:hypothetical protein ANCCAN_23873 [Ancylostoma caninum]|uniref:Uncharacterized protein n=1 Tax=Ancylostoma caninum TaxID=29170 RepID=A0A368FJK5_ANCCA|nr:hypothetical protein ANCCAN_23873 [Ancylostoma caninum]